MLTKKVKQQVLSPPFLLWCPGFGIQDLRSEMKKNQDLGSGKFISDPGSVIFIRDPAKNTVILKIMSESFQVNKPSQQTDASKIQYGREGENMISQVPDLSTVS